MKIGADMFIKEIVHLEKGRFLKEKMEVFMSLVSEDEWE